MIDIIYIRVSTDDKGQNPENQLPNCLSIAPKGAIIYEEKQSAWKDHIKLRPIFANIVNLIKDGKVNSVTVWDLDRIYRKRVKTVEFMYLCAGKKVLIQSYRQKFLNDFDKILDSIDKSSSMYWMIEDMVKDMKDRMIKIFGWIAEEESNKKSERVKIAFENHKGKKWGRASLPKRVVEIILSLNKRGLSIRKIADHQDVYYYDKNKNIKKVSKSGVHKIISENKG